MKILDTEAVILAAEETTVLSHKTIVVSDLLDLIERKLGQKLVSGTDCSVLSPDSRWKQGKVRLALIFEEKAQADSMTDDK